MAAGIDPAAVGTGSAVAAGTESAAADIDSVDIAAEAAEFAGTAVGAVDIDPAPKPALRYTSRRHRRLVLPKATYLFS